MRNCKICLKQLKFQKVYCSVKCQSIGTKNRLTLPKVEKTCPICNNIFKVKNTSKRTYCSKTCVNILFKTKYKGENNPAYNRVIKDSEREIRSIKAKNTWKVNRDKIISALKTANQEYFEKNNCYFGWDEKSIQKRTQTNIEKFGFKHNWENSEIRKKCETTCIEKYNENSWKIATRKLFNTKSTKIENTIQSILKNNDFQYEKNYYINYFIGYKVYDFYIPSLKLLIEADGDYWHGNPLIYSFDKLNEVQIKNKINDSIKNEIARVLNYNLIRFFETDINQNNFEETLITKINNFNEKI